MCSMCEHDSFHIGLNCTASPYALQERWRELVDLSENVGNLAEEKARQWRNATDQDIKDSLWSDYQSMERDYQVIAAWRELVYSAYIFCIRGAESEFMDEFFVREAGTRR